MSQSAEFEQFLEAKYDRMGPETVERLQDKAWRSIELVPFGGVGSFSILPEIPCVFTVLKREAPPPARCNYMFTLVCPAGAWIDQVMQFDDILRRFCIDKGFASSTPDADLDIYDTGYGVVDYVPPPEYVSRRYKPIVTTLADGTRTITQDVSHLKRAGMVGRLPRKGERVIITTLEVYGLYKNKREVTPRVKLLLRLA